MLKGRVPATTEVAEHLSNLKAEMGRTHLAFARGIRMWERGDGFPPRPPDNDDGSSAVALTWMGYMVARSLDFNARVKLAEKLNGDTASVEPDPRLPQ